MKLGLTGAHGFVGSEIASVHAALYADDAAWTSCIELPRVPSVIPRSGESTDDAARRTEAEHASGIAALDAALVGLDAVINAAGKAEPDSLDDGPLLATNAVVPVVLARAAARAGVQRFVHVSSAAVQGAEPVYDERAAWFPDTAYSRSKAEGEQALLKLAPPDGPAAIAIYRPTSVCGPERETTRRLVKMLDQRVLPITKDGATELPLVAVENVARLALWLALKDDTTGTRIVLHPSEGVDQTTLLATLAPEAKAIPIGPAAKVLELLAKTAPAKVRPALRRLDVFINGRAQISSVTGTQFDMVPADQWLTQLRDEIGAI